MKKMFLLSVALLNTTAFAIVIKCPSIPDMDGTKGKLSLIGDRMALIDSRATNNDGWIVTQIASNYNPIYTPSTKPTVPTPLYFQEAKIVKNVVTCKYAISQNGIQSMVLSQPKSFPKLTSYGNNWTTTSEGNSVCSRSAPGVTPEIKRENCEFMPATCPTLDVLKQDKNEFYPRGLWSDWEEAWWMYDEALPFNFNNSKGTSNDDQFRYAYRELAEVDGSMICSYWHDKKTIYFSLPLVSNKKGLSQLEPSIYFLPTNIEMWQTKSTNNLEPTRDDDNPEDPFICSKSVEECSFKYWK